METKLKAAKIVTACGCDMIIINSNKLEKIPNAINKELGSYFYSTKQMTKYQHWMWFLSNVEGKIVVDDGCVEAIKMRKSLLSKGIIQVYNSFKDGSVVEICDKNDNIIAKGAVTYDSNTIRLTMGKTIKEIAPKPIIHANNIALGE